MTKTAAARKPAVAQVQKAPGTEVAVIPPAYLKAIESGETLIATALREKVAMDQLQKLLDMRKELRAEAAKGAFYDAMTRFQSLCPVIRKNKTANVRSKREGGANFTYRYAELGHIVKQVAPLLTQCGLSYRITLEYKTINNVRCQEAKCHVSHVLGHTEVSDFVSPIDEESVMNNMQKMAAAGSFAKRQAFNNAFGILTSDDDNDARGVEDNRPDPSHPEPQQQGSVRERPAPPADPTRLLPENKKRIIRARMDSAGVNEDTLAAKFGKKLDFLLDSQYDEIVGWIRVGATA